MPPRYAKGRHIGPSPRGLDKGPIDEALKPLGLEREIAKIVGSFSAVLALARASDLIAVVPERHTENLRTGMYSFPLPVTLPEITVHCSGTRGWMQIRRTAGCVRDRLPIAGQA